MGALSYAFAGISLSRLQKTVFGGGFLIIILYALVFQITCLKATTHRTSLVGFGLKNSWHNWKQLLSWFGYSDTVSRWRIKMKSGGLLRTWCEYMSLAVVDAETYNRRKREGSVFESLECKFIGPWKSVTWFFFLLFRVIWCPPSLLATKGSFRLPEVFLLHQCGGDYCEYSLGEEGLILWKYKHNEACILEFSSGTIGV